MPTGTTNVIDGPITSISLVVSLMPKLSINVQVFVKESHSAKSGIRPPQVPSIERM